MKSRWSIYIHNSHVLLFKLHFCTVILYHYSLTHFLYKTTFKLKIKNTTTEKYATIGSPNKRTSSMFDSECCRHYFFLLNVEITIVDFPFCYTLVAFFSYFQSTRTSWYTEYQVRMRAAQTDKENKMCATFKKL